MTIFRWIERAPARFLVASILGLVVDVIGASLLVVFVSLPIQIAAVGGFSLGAVVNYYIHETWTFYRPKGGLSFLRFCKYLFSTLLVLFVRVITVTVLQAQVGPAEAGAVVILIFATGLSFLANLALSRYVVFR